MHKNKDSTFFVFSTICILPAADKEADAPLSPAYLRVLALGLRGRSVLKTASLPVIVKPVTEKRLPENLQTALCRDAFADDLFALALPSPALRIGGGHFRKTPFCLR